MTQIQSVEMGEAVPEWACAPTRKGWRLHISDVDGGGVLKRDADAKAGYLIGRNGQVWECLFVDTAHPVTVYGL